MTGIFRYTFSMNLLSVQGEGALYAALFFLLCVFIVHGVKLAKIGYRTLGKKLPLDPPPKPEKKPEPVYYIVEKKQKRTKAEYSEPKRIKFH